MSKTWRLLLEYQGTEFSGWQRQPGIRTVQLEVENALSRVLGGEPVRVFASGRTDSGVHAYGQVASFQTCVDRHPAKLRDGLNATLPPDVACLEAAVAHPDFHALRSAVGKLYRYVIRVGPVPTALARGRSWQVRYALDVRAMATALAILEGEHDFTSFRAAGCAARSPVRTITRAEIEVVEGELWIELYGTGFLRHMVRNIVGSLHEVGRHKQPPEWFGELLELRDRTKASATAPALGLHLVRVDYPSELLRDD